VVRAQAYLVDQMIHAMMELVTKRVSARGCALPAKT
jgi:hypothetical protein